VLCTASVEESLPPWLRNMQCLGAYLAFSRFANRINLDKINLVKSGFNEVFTERPETPDRVN